MDGIACRRPWGPSRGWERSRNTENRWLTSNRKSWVSWSINLGNGEKMALQMPKINSYWISPSPTALPVSPLWPCEQRQKEPWFPLKRFTAGMASAGLATLEGHVPLLSLPKEGRQMAAQLGFPLSLTQRRSSGCPPGVWCVWTDDHWQHSHFRLTAPCWLPFVSL